VEVAPEVDIPLSDAKVEIAPKVKISIDHREQFTTKRNFQSWYELLVWVR